METWNDIFYLLSEWYGSFLDFIYPPQCPICQKRLERYKPICCVCLASVMKQCLITHHSRENFHHLEDTFYLQDVVTFWSYTEIVEKLIHLVKYESRQKLGRIIGGIASQCLERELPLLMADLVVPVPLHRYRQRERGFNQSKIYASQISERTGIQMLDRGIRRHRNTRTQTLLSVSERQNNVRNAFHVTNPELLMDQTILLVDDVITSGATINNCAKACMEAGAKSVIGVGMVRPALCSSDLN
jgi:competence protein ComFC